jgi:hypothetical protein
MSGPAITSPSARGLPETGEDPAIRLCDTAQDWIDILSSKAAEELARLTPGNAARSLFLDNTYLKPLAAALDQAASTGENQPD